MHSYIYQIGTKPFNDEQALNPDTIEVGDRVFFDYAYNISAEERTYAIRGLVETILPKGMFSLDPDNNLIYNGGLKYGVSHTMIRSFPAPRYSLLQILWEGENSLS